MNGNYLSRTYPRYKIRSTYYGHANHYREDFRGTTSNRYGNNFTAVCKHVKILTKADIDDVADGWYQDYPDKLFFIPLKTKVSTEVRLYAKQKNVEIVRLEKNYDYMEW